MLTERLTVVGPALHAVVGVLGAISLVVHREADLTPGTDHQTGQQGRTRAYGPSRFGARPIGSQLRLVLVILVGGDVGRTVPRQEGVPGSRIHHHAAGLWSSRLLSTRIHLPATIDIGTGVERVLEH